MQGGVPRGIRVPAQSRQHIRAKSDLLREFLALGTHPYNVENFEHWLDRLEVVFHVAEQAELGDREGITLPDQDEIHLREDVYEALLRGEPRARFTAVHELGHWTLRHSTALPRLPRGETHTYFEDSEWQADAFAAEFLMPAEHAKGYRSAVNLAKAFGVSLDSAIIRMKVLRSEGLLRR